jgi:hypothetical protein
MAVNVDTVYQRVLAIANKEQRGYITPLEFNLFANQAQMEIFEQYFYDLHQAERGVGNDSQYNDPVKMLLEKIQPFEKRHEIVTVTSQHNSYLPADVYRLGEVIWYGSTAVPRTTIIEEVTEKEVIDLGQSPLATYSLARPVFVRRHNFDDDDRQLITIYPNSADPTGQVALFFTQNGDIDASDTVDQNVDTGGNINFIETGQTVTSSNGGIPADTTVVSINYTTGDFALSNSVTGVDAADVTLTFRSDDIKCNYIRKPIDVVWGYEEIPSSDSQGGSTALYNVSNSTNFELHASEENELVLQVLKLAGVNTQDQGLVQYSASEQAIKNQQEKS